MTTQVAAGTDFVQKTLQAFNVSTISSKIIIDMHGNDGFVALSTVEDCLKMKLSFIVIYFLLQHAESAEIQPGGNVVAQPPKSLFYAVPLKEE